MHIYYDHISKTWICEAEFLGRKYIGEGSSFDEAEKDCLEWENALANEVQNEPR